MVFEEGGRVAFEGVSEENSRSGEGGVRGEKCKI